MAMKLVMGKYKEVADGKKVQALVKEIFSKEQYCIPQKRAFAKLVRWHGEHIIVVKFLRNRIVFLVSRKKDIVFYISPFLCFCCKKHFLIIKK